jgi:arginine-tRNA-protein transferase
VRWFIEQPTDCPYLPEERASREVRIMVDVSPAAFSALLERGWRRFGPVYFRPACPACDACVPVRIPVSAFAPSASQRRAYRHSLRLTRTTWSPLVDDERLALYRRWHAQREARRGWDPSGLDAEQYAFDFAFPHPSVREITYRDPADGNRLVGVGITDLVPNAISAVYFFWDPEHAPPSLGVAHIVHTIDDAAALGCEYVYLGYRVDNCPSLAYKGRYRPQQELAGRPADDEPAQWMPASGRPDVSGRAG